MTLIEILIISLLIGFVVNVGNIIYLFVQIIKQRDKQLDEQLSKKLSKEELETADFIIKQAKERRRKRRYDDGY